MNSERLRVSVAIYNRVLFPHPQDGTLMLALERKATARGDRWEAVRVRSQPFGGAVRILDPVPLQNLIGKIQFDSDHSQSEQDFRISIPTAKWEAVKQYCLHNLANPEDSALEFGPDRELTEEFAEAIHVDLKQEQYTVQPLGFVLEDKPVPTENEHARGQLTVRLYQIFEVHLLDNHLCEKMLTASQQFSDQDLARLAFNDSSGQGHANSILALPFSLVTESYLALPHERRYRKIRVENHELDESVLAILDVEIPQYQRAA